jgi:hypothetical protein
LDSVCQNVKVLELNEPTARLKKELGDEAKSEELASTSGITPAEL